MFIFFYVVQELTVLYKLNKWIKNRENPRWRNNRGQSFFSLKKINKINFKKIKKLTLGMRDNEWKNAKWNDIKEESLRL